MSTLDVAVEKEFVPKDLQTVQRDILLEGFNLLPERINGFLSYMKDGVKILYDPNLDRIEARYDPKPKLVWE